MGGGYVRTRRVVIGLLVVEAAEHVHARRQPEVAGREDFLKALARLCLQHATM